MKIVTRGAVIRLAILAGVGVVFCLWGCSFMTKMPGKSYSGQLPVLTEEQIALRGELVRDVEKLAGEIGERNVMQHHKLAAAADFIETSLEQIGSQIRRQDYEVDNTTCSNIEFEITGAKNPQQIVIVGAHYDSAYGSAGANDNASGVAATLALARRFAGKETGRTLRFVLFTNEEPPFFQTEQMGSLVYAKSCREKGEDIVCMISLECMGYYCDQPNSQQYPFPFNLIYPSTGNFIGFAGDLSSRKLLHGVVRSFRENCKFPSEGGAIPRFITGISWSDHWSFWQQDYPAIMVTDTAIFRYPHYHTAEDTPDKIDYDRLARVVSGMEAVIAEMASYPDQ